MGRILFFLLIGLVLWLLLRNVLQQRKREDEPRDSGATTKGGEDFVACARCGVNLPRSEARVEGGKFYCVDQSTCKHAG